MKKKTIIKLGDIEIKNQRFHQYKRPISIKNRDIDKIFKHFIGYKDAKKNTPLCIFLPKMSAYRKDFDETFLIKNDELLEKYNEIWEKVKNSIRI